MKKISIICSSQKHPVYNFMVNWQEKMKKNYDIELVNSAHDLRKSGDFLFLVSCNEMISKSIRDRFKYTLILHASDLPKGRGWNPHIWEVIKGANFITLTLLEAEDKVDSGKIWSKKRIDLDGKELHDEINKKLFTAEIELIEYALKHHDKIVPLPQSDKIGSSYYRKRTAEDSCIDVSKSIVSQFNLLRVCDPERYPAFIDLNGCRYSLTIKKIKNKPN